MLHFKFFFNTRELQLTYMIYGNCLSIGTVLKERKNVSAGFYQIWLKTGIFFFLWKIFVAYIWYLKHFLSITFVDLSETINI